MTVQKIRSDMRAWGLTYNSAYKDFSVDLGNWSFIWTWEKK